MERKILLVPLVLLTLSIITPAIARVNPAPFLEAQMKIVYVKDVIPRVEYYFGFEGVVGGPNGRGGTIEGVGHFITDPDGIGHIDAQATITDKDGDTVEFHMTALNPIGNPNGAVYPFADATAMVTDATGKYLGLVGSAFRVGGFLSARYCVHMVWYYP